MGFKATDIMTKQFVAVRRDDSLDDVLEQLLRHHVSGLPVVDGDGRLEGIITEHDLLELLYKPYANVGSVSGYFTTEVVTVEETTSLTEIADLFLSQPIRRLPVVRNHRLVGIISRRDLVRYIHEVRVRLAHELSARQLVEFGAE